MSVAKNSLMSDSSGGSRARIPGCSRMRGKDAGRSLCRWQRRARGSRRAPAAPGRRVRDLPEGSLHFLREVVPALALAHLRAQAPAAGLGLGLDAVKQLAEARRDPFAIDVGQVVV